MQILISLIKKPKYKYMFKKNINYLFIFFIFIVLGNMVTISKKLVDILRSKIFNILFVLFLIKTNSNHLHNTCIYFIFLVVLSNQQIIDQ